MPSFFYIIFRPFILLLNSYFALIFPYSIIGIPVATIILRRFFEQIPKEIKELSKEQDVYLICACHNKKKQCHRFILIEMINNLGN